MKDNTLTAVQYGIGPIGRQIVEVAEARGFEFIGAIDIDPDIVGTDVGRIVGLERDLGVMVTDDAEAALASSPDVVFHSTGSAIETVVPQLESALAAGADVISTCEELAYPWYANESIASDLDACAREMGQTVLGTGINPGFAMDTFPLMGSAVCREVESIAVERVQDAATRRKPLQAKIGVGRSVEQFEADIATEGGHVGLQESVAMIAGAFGWDLDEITESIDPMIADEPTESEYFSVDTGEVRGIHQIATGHSAGEVKIELDLTMALNVSKPRDRTNITGTPDLAVTVDGGFHGDITTPAVVVNTVNSIRSANPGLATMVDVSVPSYWD